MFHLCRVWAAIFSRRYGYELPIWLSQKTSIVDLNNINLFLFCGLGTVCLLQGCNYSRIASTNAPTFSWQFFSASLTNLTVRLPLWHDCSCSVSKGILAPPPFWWQKDTDLWRITSRTHPTCDTSLRLKLETLWNYSCHTCLYILWKSKFRPCLGASGV
jgi:hypothetical protein